MGRRIEQAGQLFREGYNCSQSVFAAFCDLYGIDTETALKLSASFGGGMGRMREVCGAVSGMFMVAGLETGSADKMDHEGKKYNYEVVQRLSEEFKKNTGSIICRDLLGLNKDEVAAADTNPEKRTENYYKKRPCEQLVKDAAEIIERVLLQVTLEQVETKEQIEQTAILADMIWHEHYKSILTKEQIDYMVETFQSVEAISKQKEEQNYHYYLLKNCGGFAGYFAYQENDGALFLSKFYIDKKYRGRGYARYSLNFMENLCKEKNLSVIRLTVNKNNEGSINVYESLGFMKKDAQVSDIGHGFYMDDFVMEKSL